HRRRVLARLEAQGHAACLADPLRVRGVERAVFRRVVVRPAPGAAAGAGAHYSQQGEGVVMIARIIAIGFIFVCTSVAWIVLAGVTSYRTDRADSGLRTQV